MELKSGDRVRIVGQHSRDERDIPSDLAAQLRDPNVTAEAKAKIRDEIDRTVGRPQYRYGEVVGFEPSPRIGDPPRVQIVTDDDRNAPKTMVPTQFPDGRTELVPQITTFTTCDAADVELAG